MVFNRPSSGTIARQMLFGILGVAISILGGCGTLALNPAVTGGTVSFDKSSFPANFSFSDIDGNMAGRDERALTLEASRLMKARGFDSGALYLGVLSRHVKQSGVFASIVDSNGDYVFTATDLRNSLTILKNSPGIAFAEANFRLVLKDKKGGEIWATTVWIDEYEEHGKVLVSDGRSNASRVEAALQISAEQAGIELEKTLKEALEKGKKEAAEKP